MSPDFLSISGLQLAARQIYPGHGLGTLKNRLKFTAAALRWRGSLAEALAQPAHKRLRRELEQLPIMLGFVRWPYIHCDWSVLQRFDALSQHYQALEDDMTALDVGIESAIEVADLTQLSPRLRLIVDHAPWSLREGSLVFSPYFGEHRLQSIVFSFTQLSNERAVYVGNVQGSNVEAAQANFSDVQKDLLGVRLRDFTIKTFQLLMYSLGVKRILCIAESARHHRHPYFSREKVTKLHLDYDAVWREHSGEQVEGGFYRLDMLPRMRPIEEVASKHRSLYRKRYAMMNEIAAGLELRFGRK